MYSVANVSSQGMMQFFFTFSSVDSPNVTCVTAGSNSTTIRGQGAVTVTIDNHDLTTLGFDYDNNPTFSDISPRFSFERYNNRVMCI